MKDDVEVQLDKIREALRSYKVDSYMMHEFEIRRELISDLINFEVAFTAKVTHDCPELDGEMTRIGDIAIVMTPYSQIPSLVNNPLVLYLEASRSAGISEANLADLLPRKRSYRLYYIGTAIIILTALVLIGMTLAEIRIGLWIFVPMIIGFVIQIYGIIRIRPRSIGRLHNSK